MYENKKSTIFWNKEFPQTKLFGSRIWHISLVIKTLWEITRHSPVLFYYVCETWKENWTIVINISTFHSNIFTQNASLYITNISVLKLLTRFLINIKKKHILKPKIHTNIFIIFFILSFIIRSLILGWRNGLLNLRLY